LLYYVKAVEEIEQHKSQDDKGDDQKFHDDYLLVSILAVLHLFEFLLDHHDAVHAAFSHIF
jgi:hypothetical protein